MATDGEIVSSYRPTFDAMVIKTSEKSRKWERTLSEAAEVLLNRDVFAQVYLLTPDAHLVPKFQCNEVVTLVYVLYEYLF